MNAIGQRLAKVSVLLSILASCILAAAPVYSSGATLLEKNGFAGAFALSLPIVLSLAGLCRPGWIRFPAALALLVFAFVTAIGIYYLPAALFLILAGYRNGRSQ